MDTRITWYGRVSMVAAMDVSTNLDAHTIDADARLNPMLYII
jgi:hypothetical protein